MLPKGNAIYFLDQDISGQWYVINKKNSEAWFDWLDQEAYDDDGAYVPDYAVLIGKDFTRISFNEDGSYTIK